MKISYTKQGINNKYKRVGKTIYKAIYRTINILLIISIAFANFIGFEITAEADTAAVTELSPDYKSYAKTKYLELFVDESKGTIAVKDLRNGYIWKSVVDQDMYDLNSLNDQWKMYLQSIMAINYIDLSKRDTSPSRTFSSSDTTKINVSKINNGAIIEYNFEAIGISVTLEFSLEDDCLIVKIPDDKIVESTATKEQTTASGAKEIVEVQYGLVSIELLPFLGAATDDVDGYLLYPDGPGGLTIYSEVKNRPADVIVGKWKVYTSEKVEMNYLFGEEAARYRAYLPIIGVKNNNNAFLGAITYGMEDAGITVYPSGYVVKLNHINFEFTYRYHYNLAMSSVSIDNNLVGRTVYRAEKDRIHIDREIRFFMLSDEKANYSEMANVYRNYLVKSGMLEDKIPDGSNVPLALEIFMGIKKQQMLFDKFITMTSIKQTIDMLETFKANGVDNISTILRGWQKGGYGEYPNNWPFESKLGSKKDIAKLNEYVKSKNIDLYLENCFDYAILRVGGFSTNRDVVLDGSGLPVLSEYSQAYLLNPTVAAKRNQKFLENLRQYDAFNVAYEDLGRVIYQDYNKNYPSRRHETVLKWQEMLKDAKDNGRKVATDGANQYVYKYADFIYNVTTTAYGYFITDKEIPFLQMVLHGMINYSTEYGNLSYDLQIQKLKWVEYGSAPTFILTAERSLKLMDTGYESLFSTSFEFWKDDVIETYREFNERLKNVYGSQIIYHDEIAPNVIEMHYSNGYKVYINYNDSSYTVNGMVIPAKDYVVVAKGEKIQ